MVPLSIAVLGLFAMIWTFHFAGRRGTTAPMRRPASTPRASTPLPRTAAAPQPAPRPSVPALLDWTASAAPAAPANPSAQRPKTLEGEELRLRLRDRYVAARFPGVARNVLELEKIELVIKAARLYFEEEQYDRGLELLDMAIVQSSGDQSLQLARLEIAFLVRDRPRFIAHARTFLAAHPGDAHWGEITRLGRALAPAVALFAADSDEAQATHYGPWPDMPNWIQASWDLTAEVNAADFHSAMANLAQPADGHSRRAAH
jgi:hypothetical protein